MKLRAKRTILIGFAFLSISAFWQMYDSIIPLILKYTFNLKETPVGAIMAIDNVLALFLLPVFGVWSDRCNTRIGKRAPFIYIGTILSAGLLLLLHVQNRPGNLIPFIIVLFVLLLSMSFYRSPAVALMPDLTPPPLRSKGNAVINLMGAVGFIYALVMIKIFGGKAEECPSYLPLFLTISGLMLISILILAFFINENKLAKLVRSECAEAGISMDPVEEKSEDGQAAGRLSAPVRRSLVFLLCSVAFWYIAYNAVTTAFSRYATEMWSIGSDYADCLLIASVAAVISYLPIGIISGKLGRKKVILAGVVIMALSYAALFFYTTYHVTAVLFFLLIGIGWAAINVNSLPMVVDMCSAGDIGRFTGYYYTFSMAAQVITPIASGALLQYVSYRTLFPYSVCFMILAFITMSFVKHGDTKPLAKASLLEHFDAGD
ncbi:MAG: MFS transporter [Lachnospiraceae bacterium]|nr:MFS transporter [Lachnospiraceae bacterium]